MRCGFLVWLLVAVAATAAPVSEDARFEYLCSRFVDEYLALFPELATTLGDHRFDHLLNDNTAAGRQRSVAFFEDYVLALGEIDRAALDPQNQVDFDILRHNLNYGRFALVELREWEWNPLYYHVAGAIHPLLVRDFAPLPQRLAAVKGRLEALPAALAAARENLRYPPRLHTETAIRQNQGTIVLISRDLARYAQQAGLAEELAGPREAALEALQDYGRFLELELLPRSTGDFRLGEDLFRQKLRFALDSEMPLEELRRRASRELEVTRQALYETALPLYRRQGGESSDPEVVVRAVLDELAQDRPDNQTLLPAVQKVLAATTEFVRRRGLVSVPRQPIDVVEMPEFNRGVTVAYCEAPGALEDGGRTFFALSPAPVEWAPDRVESFFREYNHSMLADVVFHEAMPGHFLQQGHSNAYQGRTAIRALFANGTFVEGWATYAEQLMVEEGYGGPEVRMQQLKMRLRVVLNALLDQGIHAGTMTRDEALRLMTEQGFQEEQEAAGKWNRACLTSTQLSTYLVGLLEMNDLRSSYRARFGLQRSPKAMHDAILSFGSPAPRHVRRLLGL